MAGGSTSVVRGDAVAVGVALIVLGALALVYGVAVGPLAWAALAVAVPAGALMIARGRAAYRTLLREEITKHAGFDPGPSPVPWIDDTVWRAVNGFDAGRDAPMILRKQVEPHLRVFGDDAVRAFEDPRLRSVSEDERRLAGGRGEAVQEPPDLEALLAALAATPGRFIALGIRVPVCCGALARLVSLAPGPSDAGRYLPAGGPEEGSEGRVGLHAFVCAACGARYSTDPAW